MPSAHADEIHHEHERLARPDHAAGAALAVGEVGRDRDAPAPADLHPRHAAVPAGDDLALAELELERVAAVPARVELAAVLPRHADVVDLDDLAGLGLVAVADLDVLQLELVGGRLVGDLDLGLVHARHGTHPPASTASKPAAFSSAITTSRWSPWSSITPSFAEPPTPQRFFSRPASSRTPASSSGRLEIVVTALPRRPAVSRRTFTRPPAVWRCLGSLRLRRRSPSSLDQTGL